MASQRSVGVLLILLFILALCVMASAVWLGAVGRADANQVVLILAPMASAVAAGLAAAANTIFKSSRRNGQSR